MAARHTYIEIRSIYRNTPWKQFPPLEGCRLLPSAIRRRPVLARIDAPPEALWRHRHETSSTAGHHGRMPELHQERRKHAIPTYACFLLGVCPCALPSPEAPLCDLTKSRKVSARMWGTGTGPNPTHYPSHASPLPRFLSPLPVHAPCPVAVTLPTGNTWSLLPPLQLQTHGAKDVRTETRPDWCWAPQ